MYMYIDICKYIYMYMYLHISIYNMFINCYKTKVH